MYVSMYVCAGMYVRVSARACKYLSMCEKGEEKEKEREREREREREKE